MPPYAKGKGGKTHSKKNMAKKRSLSKKSKEQPANAQSSNENVREIATQVQQALKDGNFEEAITGAKKLEELLLDDEAAQTIYLTSLVWEIRAMQGLKRSAEEIGTAADKYADEAVRLGDFARAVQAHRIHAQVIIDSGAWLAAVEQLESALNLAIEHQFGRETLEILMHLSALELKMCHYVEAIDYLSRAMNAIQPAGVVHEDFRELSAVGNRQLCELYDTIGDGQRACDALEAAQNAGTHDPEELWMQQLLLSRLDLRSGNADDACARLEHVESEVKKAVREGKSRPEQVAMVELEHAQAIWCRAQFKEAFDKLSQIECDSRPIRLAVALTRFQWAVETGKPTLNPDKECADFGAVCNETGDDVDVQISLAAALAQASWEIEKGHYEPTFKSLLYIAQAAAFTQLVPFATRALALRSELHFAQGNYSQSAMDAQNACETFVDHVDDVSARQAAAMMLRAQYAEVLAQNPKADLDDNETQAFNQLLQDFERFMSHHHISAGIALGLILAKIAHMRKDDDTVQRLLYALEKYIDPKWMAYSAMVFDKLIGTPEAIARAQKIAAENEFAF